MKHLEEKKSNLVKINTKQYKPRKQERREEERNEEIIIKRMIKSEIGITKSKIISKSFCGMWQECGFKITKQISMLKKGRKKKKTLSGEFN